MADLDVHLVPSLSLALRVPGKGFVPRRIQEDETGLIAAFRDWTLAEQVFPLRGTLGGGPDSYYGVFDVADAPKIMAWLREHDLPTISLGEPDHDHEECPDCHEATLGPDDHKCPNEECPSHGN